MVPIVPVAIPQYNPATRQGNWNPPDGTVKDTIVFHDMEGYLSGTDSIFKDPTKVVSAQFGVGQTEVHQYTPINAVAFHAGNYAWNQRSIGIEHEGGIVNASLTIPYTDAMYENSIQLIHQICIILGKTIADFQIKRHSDIVSTPCCGSLDVGRIVAGVKALEAESVATVTLSSTTVKIPVTVPKTFQPFLTDLAPSEEYRDEVKRMQSFLTAKGLFADAGPQDGYYGPKTQDAVHAFQVASGIAGVGVSPQPFEWGWWYKETRGAANKNLTIAITNNA